MYVFLVIFELCYPKESGDGKDIKEAYVLAEDFSDAIDKVKKRYKEKFQHASINEIKSLEADIIV